MKNIASHVHILAVATANVLAKSAYIHTCPYIHVIDHALYLGGVRFADVTVSDGPFFDTFTVDVSKLVKSSSKFLCIYMCVYVCMKVYV